MAKIVGLHMDFSVKLVPGPCQEIRLLFVTCYYHMDTQDASGTGWRKRQREGYLRAYNRVKYGGTHHSARAGEE